MATQTLKAAFSRAKETQNKVRFDADKGQDISGSLYLGNEDERAEAQTLVVSVTVPKAD